MPEIWTGEIVGRMHLLNISARRLAKQMGCCPEYVSMILHGKRCPKNVKERFERAIQEIVAQRQNNEKETTT